METDTCSASTCYNAEMGYKAASTPKPEELSNVWMHYSQTSCQKLLVEDPCGCHETVGGSVKKC